jgi:hypothetical protein
MIFLDGSTCCRSVLKCLRFFEHHILGFLVFTESKKNGLAQALIARQFAKLDLTYQLRFNE